AAERGIALGFWGSLAFHAGLLLCFIAIPLSAFNSFSGNLLLTQGAVVPLREGVRPDHGADPCTLPAGTVSVEDLRGIYLKGKFKLDFGGTLLLDRDGRAERLPFSVNQPVSSGGFQFSLQEYGFAPRLVVTGAGLPAFDYFLNLTHPEEGDYFPLPKGGLRLFVALLPDFFRDKDKIGSRSREPRNPYLLVKVFQGEKVLVERLVKVGESVEVEGYSIAAQQLGNWVNLAVSRERGLLFIILGSLVVTLGLLVRFLSNERRLELEILPAAGGCSCRLKGYSRYYPAFLENEVVGFFDKLKHM
ncbi:MAG TPA: cytochrome c biogenesis protein ResB, partial [Geomonas sp.]